MANSYSPETRLTDITAGQFEEILTRALTKSAATMKIISLRCNYADDEVISIAKSEMEKLGVKSLC